MSCRLCKHVYKKRENGKLEVYFKLFTSRSKNITPAERLLGVGIRVENNHDESDSICKGCEASIKCLESAASIREKWGFSQTGSDERNDGFQTAKKVIVEKVWIKNVL